MNSPNLIVEDTPVDNQKLPAILEEKGCRIGRAPNGALLNVGLDVLI